MDELVLHAEKEDLAECARLLAMNVAHYEMKYGVLPLEEKLTVESEFTDQHAELVTMAMEAMAGVLGSVIQGWTRRLSIDMNDDPAFALLKKLSDIETVAQELPRIGKRRGLQDKTDDRLMHQARP